MALINTSVPNLIQGVSQQPDATRFDGQCEEQENALSSVAEGLKKRPNTRHVARLLQTAIGSNSFVHFVNRSESEKYVLIHDNDTGIKAWNIITGTQATINGSLNAYNDSYLSTGLAAKHLKALTIADVTYMLNSDVQVSLDSNKSAAFPKEALVSINQGDYKKDYAIKVTLPVPDTSYTFNDASVTFSLTPNYDYWSYHDPYHGLVSGTTVTSHSITGVTVTDGGSGYYDGVTLSVSSTLDVLVEPSFNISVDSSDGSIQSIQVISGGSFKGSSSNSNYLSGGTPPTLTGGFNQGTPTGVKEIFAKFTSGEGTNASVSNRANTNTIADGLLARCNVTNQGINGDNNTTTTDKLTSYFDCTQHGNLIKLKLKDSVIYDDFTITTIDSLSDTGMNPIYKEVSSITDLPAKCIDGFKVKVIGDAELNQDDYYVVFEGTGNAATGDILNGAWVETIGPDVSLGFNGSSMPCSFTNTALNTFTVSLLPTASRKVGDLESNPNPSFVGAKISNLFFFKNRLGFMSGSHVIFSEAGFGGTNEANELEYNFYRTTTTTLLDSEAIDVSVVSSRVTNLYYAVGFQENLILFSENSQFVLKGGDLLTPKTVSVSPITNFISEPQVTPLPLGSYIYFPFTRGNFSGLQEFTVNKNTDNYDSSEITEHVPAYIPSNVVDMAGTSSENIIALVSGDESNTIYIYNYFWNNQQKVLSAWSKFTFTGEIRGIEFIESTLYAVITNNGETNLVEMPLESGLSDDAGYVTHLDNRVAVTVTNGSSIITLPYTPEDNSVEVYTTDGLTLNCTNSGSTVTLSSPVSADTDVWVGLPYTMKYTFSEQLFKAKAGNGKSPSNAAKLMIRNGSLYYDKSAYFKVKVTPKFRDTYENVFTPDVVGSSVLGSLSLDSGFYRFPVFTKAQDTTITIENESALPSTFQSAEFESFVHSRSNRYG
jgi:hypothetical protein